MRLSIKETTFFDRGMEQLVAREAHNLEVVGSSPTPATETFFERFDKFLDEVHSSFLIAGWSSW